MMKKVILFVFVLFFTSGLFAAKAPKNIVFIIGDGMGLPQIYTGMVHNGNRSALERCTNTALVKTYSSDNFTTDSGAGGTALSSGIKTKNGMIGMGPDSVAVPSIMRICDDNGLSTGLVVTCAVTHATPASFVAHQINRNMYEEIAADFLTSNIDVFIGGGKKYFENRTDNRNLIRELKDKKYRTLYTLEDIKRLKTGRVAGLLFDDHAPKAAERGNYLPEASIAAINLLDNNNKGFFLMIEASQIDWACHSNDSTHLVTEMLDFEKTVSSVLDYAQKDGNTLVIITADHETGGLTIPTGNLASQKTALKFSTTNHTGVPVPVFAYGPGAENIRGIMENTAFKNIISTLLKFK
jgi:alkaline phosphatase